MKKLDAKSLDDVAGGGCLPAPVPPGPDLLQRQAPLL